jgi:hypothetical protein
MDHETASRLIQELATGTIDPREREVVEAHATECEECRQALHAFRDVAGVSLDTDASLFDPHPSADDLAAYVCVEPGLSTADLRRVARHVRVCPTCRREHEIASAALVAREPWIARVSSLLRLSTRVSMPAAIPVALAAVLLVALIPAIRGLRSPSEIEQPWSGAVPTILLSSGTRGAQIPVVTVDRGRPATLLLVEAAEPGEGTGAVTISVRRLADGVEVWKTRAEWNEVWSVKNPILSLLVPTEALEAGRHAIDLRWDDHERRLTELVIR